jgi:hypothetical protein
MQYRCIGCMGFGDPSRGYPSWSLKSVVAAPIVGALKTKHIDDAISWLATFLSYASSFSKKVLRSCDSTEVTPRADLETPLSVVESATRGESWKQGSSTITLKRCTGRHACGEYKVLETFSKDKSTSDGRNNQCKTCRGATTKLSRDMNAARLKIAGAQKSKLCPDCEIQKLALYFRVSKNHKDGLHTRCRDCQSKWDKKNVNRRQVNRRVLDANALKRCPQCKVAKNITTSFHKNGSSRDGFNTYCKKCHCKTQRAASNSKSMKERRAARMRTQYGLEEDIYYDMQRDQNWACGICGRTFEELGETPHIDHDHKTGRVRGLLCSKDNLLLGYAGDDPSLLAEKASHQHRYLSKHIRARS